MRILWYNDTMAKSKNQVSFEDALWGACDKLRGTVEPAEYKHVVLSRIFLKFVNDKFDARRVELISEDKEKYIDVQSFYMMKNFFSFQKKAAGLLLCRMLSRMILHSKLIQHSIQLKSKILHYEREKLLPIMYKGELLSKEYYADFVCYGKIIVELKAVTSLVKAHKAQVINYLKAADKEIGLLVNFGCNSLKWERISKFENMENR